MAAAPAAANPGRELVKALKKGDSAAVGALVDSSPDLLERRGMWDNTPLLVACHYGHAEMALMLLERGADPAAVNEQGATALLFACVEGMEAVASKLLLNSATNADPPACMVYSRKTDETSNRTPLQAAAENGFASGVQKLLERGATVSSDALLLAARRGEAECCATLLRALVASGALDIDSGNAATAAVVPWLSEALAAAAARGSEETLRSLCDSSVDGIAAAAASSAGEALLCVRARGADGPARGGGRGA